MNSKLHDLTDQDRNSVMTAEELQHAIGLPALAQSIAQLVINTESEWYWKPGKWDALDALLGHSNSTPNENWLAEKQRIEQLCWWHEVAPKVGLPAQGRVWHLHPIGLIGSFSQTLSDCEEKFKKISPIILRHEGRYVNDPVDPGGATNMGVAWPTWKSYAKSDLGIEPTLENLKALTQHQAEIIYFKRYWKPKGFCDLKNIKTALMIYDWTITSGKAVREVQKVLVNEFGKIVTIDNTMGRKTIDAINSIMDQEYLGQRISESRKSYYTSLTVNRDGTTNAKIKFLKGWHNRVDDCLRALP